MNMGNKVENNSEVLELLNWANGNTINEDNKHEKESLRESG